MSAPQPRMMLPSGAALCAGSPPRPPGGGSGRPACHTAAAAPIGSRPRPAARLPRGPPCRSSGGHRAGPAGRPGAALPRPPSPSEKPHQTLDQKLRGPSERGPRPGATHRGRGCRFSAGSASGRPGGDPAPRLVPPPGRRGPPSLPAPSRAGPGRADPLRGTAGLPASLGRLSPD